MSEEIANLINSALAALTQNATFPPDVEFAKNCLREAQSLLTKRAADGACAHPESFDLEYGYRMCISCGKAFQPRR